MYQFELYVPEISGMEKPLTDLEAELRKVFGGFTRYHTIGSWKNPMGQDIVNKITVYRVIDEQRLKPVIETLAEYVKEHWNQESVLWTVQQTEMFV